jgi:hypothetical protein
VFFWFNAILFAGFLIDVIKLARCYGAINRLGLSGQRGFEPLMPRGQSSAAPDAAPQGDEWPDITN